MKEASRVVKASLLGRDKVVEAVMKGADRKVTVGGEVAFLQGPLELLGCFTTDFSTLSLPP